VPDFLVLGDVHVEQRFIGFLNLIVVEIFLGTKALMELQILNLCVLLILWVIIVGLFNSYSCPRFSFVHLYLLRIRQSNNITLKLLINLVAIFALHNYKYIIVGILIKLPVYDTLHLFIIIQGRYGLILPFIKFIMVLYNLVLTFILFGLIRQCLLGHAF
jgi:hypothetical protein